MSSSAPLKQHIHMQVYLSCQRYRDAARAQNFYSGKRWFVINMAETFAREYAAPEYRDAFLQMFRAMAGNGPPQVNSMDQDRKNWRRITLSVLHV